MRTGEAKPKHIVDLVALVGCEKQNRKNLFGIRKAKPEAPGWRPENEKRSRRILLDLCYVCVPAVLNQAPNWL